MAESGTMPSGVKLMATPLAAPRLGGGAGPATVTAAPPAVDGPPGVAAKVVATVANALVEAVEVVVEVAVEVEVVLVGAVVAALVVLVAVVALVASALVEM